MSTYEPGTVARITLANGIVHPVALRLPLHEGGWATATAKYVHSCHVTDVRPLVVLDLRNAAECVRALRSTFPERMSDWDDDDARILDIADQIEAQTKPPKPAEPTGLGAVVQDASGSVYVRGYEPSDTYTHPWHIIDPSATACMAWWKWDDIDVPAESHILSRGVEVQP